VGWIIRQTEVCEVSMKRFGALPTRTESHPDILGALIAAPASSTASEPHLRPARHEDNCGQDARISIPPHDVSGGAGVPSRSIQVHRKPARQVQGSSVLPPGGVLGRHLSPRRRRHRRLEPSPKPHTTRSCLSCEFRGPQEGFDQILPESVLRC
jgi:hypothetical protein